jgi:glycosyltransferase involved in cell wall biosynthesis
LISAVVIIAWVVLAIQFCYWVAWWIAFNRPGAGSATARPPLSVIVCAHDEEQNLRALIPRLLAQEYPDFEVIIVEDRCNDGTFDFLLQATKDYPRLRMVRVQHLPPHVNGKKFALTLGIKAATHDWVILTDADCRPSNNQWLQTMASGCQADKKLILGYSPYLHEPGYLNSFIRFESLITAVQFFGAALWGHPYMGTGRNLAYRKSLFLDNKGFNNYLGLTGGDDDLFVNQHATGSNTAVVLSRDSVVFSVPKRNWTDFYHQKLRHLSVGKHYRFGDRMVLGLFSLTWILTWVFVLPVTLVATGLMAGLWIGFLVRMLTVTAVVYRSSRAMGEPFEAWKTPLLEFNYAIYYLGTGLVALVSKRVRWKN